MKYYGPLKSTDPDAPYTNGNEITGTPGSHPDAKGFEATQREIVNTIIDGGLLPSGEDYTQLKQAIKSLIDSQTKTKEDVSNKKTNLSSPNNITYPTTQAVVEGLAGIISGLIKINGGSNYIKIPIEGQANPLLICWGNISGTAGTAATFTLTFPQPFANVNYGLSFIPTNGSHDYGWYTRNKNTTYTEFVNRNSSAVAQYIAIGLGV